MGLWAWPVLLVSSLAAGLALVLLLIVPRRWDFVTLLGLALLLVVGFQGLLSILASSGRGDVAVVATALAIGMAMGGYALGAAILARMRFTPELPEVFAPDRSGPGAGASAVVVLAPVEPAEYRFWSVAEQFSDLADSGAALPPDPSLPLFYAARRDSYRSLGSSDAPGAARRIARRLERRLADGGLRDIPVGVALTGSAPRLADVVADLARAGVRKVVVTILGVGATYQTDKALSELDTLRLGAAGVTVTEADARWSSCGIPDLITDRVLRVTHVPRPAAGVVLLAEGLPETWDRVQPQAAHEEVFLIQRIRALLVESGYDASRIVDASLEWREPRSGGRRRRPVRGRVPSGDRGPGHAPGGRDRDTRGPQARRAQGGPLPRERTDAPAGLGRRPGRGRGAPGRGQAAGGGGVGRAADRYGLQRSQFHACRRRMLRQRVM